MKGGIFVNIDYFSLPKYGEIPDIGLYLEQTVTYINEIYAPLEISITSSMLSNYVKKGYIEHPINKKYYAPQIAYLLFFLPVKQTFMTEDIYELFTLQRRTYPLETAYNYFASQFQGMLQYLFGLCSEPPADTEGELSFAKRTMQSVITALAHVIYLRFCFKKIPEESGKYEADVN